MALHILRIDCPDEPGLVHKITGVLFNAGYNVLSNQEFVDLEAKHFFMRTAFEGTAAPDRMVPYLQQVLPSLAVVRLATTEKQPVVVLATTEAHCLGDLMIRYYSGELPAQIRAVIANHETLGSLVKPFGIPFHCVSHKDLERTEHEKRVMDVVDSYAPEYVVLAKYMRILTPAFVERYRNRVINIHHSFLPAFIGAKPYHQAYERGVKIIGATAHIVTDDLDTGPIIAQSVIPINHTFTAAAMAQAGRDVEKIVLARAVKLMLEERVFLHGNRTVVFE
ncbi:MAG TPA: formyltetrahydrofolate deformylase [Candidatus Limnocylindria bacterium]|nr:formyltetrahydrofolate deformylase [Candidatus Limnocylindria bacterium]